jgi:hypothetical protein
LFDRVYELGDAEVNQQPRIDVSETSNTSLRAIRVLRSYQTRAAIKSVVELLLVSPYQTDTRKNSQAWIRSSNHPRPKLVRTRDLLSLG